ncbi:hypothetical protein SK128_003562 [Halocaridina rubra]|uniref:Uncharacterized protein n=1 Tax=Halocaridina rubra TaxID=373956 RepID=A0AAN9A0Z5_HALRR
MHPMKGPFVGGQDSSLSGNLNQEFRPVPGMRQTLRPLQHLLPQSRRVVRVLNLSMNAPTCKHKLVFAVQPLLHHLRTDNIHHQQNSTLLKTAIENHLRIPNQPE